MVSTATVIWLVLSVLFSVAVFESFLAMVDALKPKAFKIAIYQVAVVAWLFGPITSQELANSWFSNYGQIDQVTWLGLWFAAVSVHAFIRGQKMAESLRRAIP